MAKDTSKVVYIASEVLMISLGKSLPHGIEFIFGDPKLSMELWNMIIGISGFDAEALFGQQPVTTTHCRVARY